MSTKEAGLGGARTEDTTIHVDFAATTVTEAAMILVTRELWINFWDLKKAQKINTKYDNCYYIMVAVNK